LSRHTKFFGARVFLFRRYLTFLSPLLSGHSHDDFLGGSYFSPARAFFPCPLSTPNPQRLPPGRFVSCGFFCSAFYPFFLFYALGPDFCLWRYNRPFAYFWLGPFSSLEDHSLPPVPVAVTIWPTSHLDPCFPWGGLFSNISFP